MSVLRVLLLQHRSLGWRLGTSKIKIWTVALKTNNTPKNVDRSRGFIKSLHMKLCNLWSGIRPLVPAYAVFDFLGNPKWSKINYNLYYGEVRGNVLRPAHGT